MEVLKRNRIKIILMNTSEEKFRVKTRQPQVQEWVWKAEWIFMPHIRLGGVDRVTIEEIKWLSWPWGREGSPLKSPKWWTGKLNPN